MEGRWKSRGFRFLEAKMEVASQSKTFATRVSSNCCLIVVRLKRMRKIGRDRRKVEPREGQDDNEKVRRYVLHCKKKVITLFGGAGAIALLSLKQEQACRHHSHAKEASNGD